MRNLYNSNCHEHILYKYILKGFKITLCYAKVLFAYTDYECSIIENNKVCNGIINWSCNHYNYWHKDYDLSKGEIDRLNKMAKYRQKQNQQQVKELSSWQDVWDYLLKFKL